MREQQLHDSHGLYPGEESIVFTPVLYQTKNYTRAQNLADSGTSVFLFKQAVQVFNVIHLFVGERLVHGYSAVDALLVPVRRMAAVTGDTVFHAVRHHQILDAARTAPRLLAPYLIAVVFHLGGEYVAVGERTIAD